MSILNSQNNFESFLNSLCCNNCKFFINGECTEIDAIEHDKNKNDLTKAYIHMYKTGWLETPAPVSEARENMLNDFKLISEKINDVFVCEKFIK